jgi:hypothetical protein
MHHFLDSLQNWPEASTIEVLKALYSATSQTKQRQACYICDKIMENISVSGPVQHYVRQYWHI